MGNFCVSDILRVQTEHFELSIWCRDISARQAAYKRTLHQRSGSDSDCKHRLQLSSELTTTRIESLGRVIGDNESSEENWPLPEPVFFENMLYQVEIIFFSAVEYAELNHALQRLNDAFRFSAASHHSSLTLPARLTGSFNSGNDVGWLTLPFSFSVRDETHHFSLSMEVLPTKMDLHADLPVMYRCIDAQLPLWRFSIAEQTEHDASKGQSRGSFPLLWLANFKSLREKFEDGLRVISQAPHNRLKPLVSHVKADKLKGRLSHKLENKIRESINAGLLNKRYKVDKQVLSVDTHENRFIKMVVSHCQKQLRTIEKQLQEDNQNSLNPRLSEAFFSELSQWQRPLTKALSQSFLKEVGTFSGLLRESLVLQQQTGYSAVYHSWLELKYYLDTFANQATLSVRSVAEVYEVWCFLSLRHILIESLGFEDVTAKQLFTEKSTFLEHKLRDGLAGSFKFRRSDGISVALTHEPMIKRFGSKVRSYVVNQKPDIVLEVCFPEPSRKKLLWVFDAKYRINHVEKEGKPTDLAPDDAINQMHRYRDALIRINQDKFALQKQSRPVVGAYALYPGYFNQPEEDNPYSTPISNVDIGAFAMLPQEGDSGLYWLTQFLRDNIGLCRSQTPYAPASKLYDDIHIKESARISYAGLKSSLYDDLCLTIALGGSKGRDKDYFSRYTEGKMRHYHTPQATLGNELSLHVIQELRYLALAGTSDTNSNHKQIDRVWPIENVELRPRNQIAADIAGKDGEGNTNPYFLFTLGKPMTLLQPILGVPHRPFANSIKLTTLKQLQSHSNFSQLDTMYLD